MTALWAAPVTPRPPLPGDLTVDVVIVGAGYTGLWTAYYLAAADPGLRIAVLEARTAGFGASGRNGGWCSALLPTSLPALTRRHGRDAAVALTRAMRSTVDEVGWITLAEGIECDFAKGGTVMLARSAPQLARARASCAEDPDLTWLTADEARTRVGATHVLGGTYTPHCAAIHPFRLVRGLAEAAERRGVTIYEQTPVRSLRPGAATCDRGTVRASVVVRATEGYTPSLPGFRRTLMPVYSLMIATEPLPDSFWHTAGLHRRETFGDHRNLIIYGQRTRDDRLAFGGRGAPYHYGSRVAPSYDSSPKVFKALRLALTDLFPALRDAPITHAWGGPLGVPRDWHPSVGLADGLAWAGGYVGDGVAASNLAGRTLADLITGKDTDLTHLPWVNHHSPRWEPEPLRWLGVNAALHLTATADTAESRTNRPARRLRLTTHLTGH